ncbi:hypothetical protein, partial [Escherichia coli]|uniref:hypothetical protein n=1 Tax=Escherichia coli TaxID=562 RepID=UPI0019D635C4
TIGEGELMAHDVPLGCAPDEYDDLISGTCSHLPQRTTASRCFIEIVEIPGMVLKTTLFLRYIKND